MNVKRKQETREYPQSWGNAALVDESVAPLNTPEVRNLSLVPVVVRDIPEGEFGDDSLGPAKGVILGIGLSITLWCIIILVMSWIPWK